MDFISVTDAARQKDCGRTTIYRAADDGRINAQQVAGRRLVVHDDTFRDFQPKRIGARAARQQEEGAGE